MGAVGLAKEELAGGVYSHEKMTVKPPSVQCFHADQPPHNGDREKFGMFGGDSFKVINDGVVVGGGLDGRARQKVEVGDEGRRFRFESELPPRPQGREKE